MSEFGWPRRRRRDGRPGGPVRPAPTNGHEVIDGSSTDEDADPTIERPDGEERVESFLLRISVDRAGRAVRSSVVHVRSAAEHHERGWCSAAATAFINDCARLGTTEPDEADNEPDDESEDEHVEPAPVVDLPDASPAVEVPVAPPARLTEVPAADEAALTCPAARARSTTARASRARGEERTIVVAGAGLHIGGGEEDVDVVLDTAALPPGGFGFHATLLGRALDRHASARTGWIPLGHLTGRGNADVQLALRFPRVQVGHGLHRLRVRLDLSLAAQPTRVPVLKGPASEVGPASQDTSLPRRTER